MYRRKKYNILFLNLYFCGEFAKKKKKRSKLFTSKTKFKQKLIKI